MNRLILPAVMAFFAAPALAQSGAQSAPPHMPADLTPAGVRAADDHLALEQIDGAEAMAFVAEENRKSLAALTGDPRYEAFRQQAFDILSAEDRTPTPHFQGEAIFNFWQDAANPKGVWRRTTLDSYRTATPAWTPVLDIDALAKAEGRDWVWKGAACLAPDETRCLISLSDGGKDAVVMREFDTATGVFVAAGFGLAEGKHDVEWLDQDTLLVATDFGTEDGRATLTESGYPYIVRALRRGQSLDQATEVYRGDISDGGYGVSPSVYRDRDGKVEAVIVSRPLDTYRSETWQLVEGRPVRLNLPEKVQIYGTVGGRLVVSNDQPWSWSGHAVPEGSLLALDLASLAEGGPGVASPDTDPDTIFTPGPRQSLQEVAILGDEALVSISDTVVGRLMRFRFGAEGRPVWTGTPVPVPDNSAVGLVDASKARGQAFVSTEGFLTPPTLGLFALDDGVLAELKSAPARFDASRDVVEQFEATSTDGTRILYFLVRPKAAPMDGSIPTLMFGYGGFQIAFPPAYKPEMGKLWLENGGAFVIANIRGGGEFGPAWHEAVLKAHRQLAFDDFAAVARDLETRGVTSPRRLGVYGRSNGGVLTSVSVTQHPELFNAAVIESPLIDMLRYHELPAGASWIGEYGDPRIPAEAAFIARYSAYQQLRPEIAYPRVYITTNTRDDRVHPGHARKFAARLGDQGHDHLYYEETSGGHSNDADPVANARRWARHYVYLSQQLMD